MPDIGGLARLIATIGVLLVIAGLALGVLGRIPFFGRLPGDIHIRKGNFSFHFPLATCLLISLILTLLAWAFRKR